MYFDRDSLAGFVDGPRFLTLDRITLGRITPGRITLGFMTASTLLLACGGSSADESCDRLESICCAALSGSARDACKASVERVRSGQDAFSCSVRLTQVQTTGNCNFNNSDAGTDTGTDVGQDAGSDTVDADTNDACIVNAPDAGTDAGPPQPKMDVKPTDPPPTCDAPQTAWKAGDAVFEEITESWSASALGQRLYAVDYDSDGYPDLVAHEGGGKETNFSGGVRPFTLLRNKDGAGFEDVTQSSKILTFPGQSDDNLGRPVQIIGFSDVDNDGDLDAFIGAHRTDTADGYHSGVMLNQGDGTFLPGPEGDADRKNQTSAPSGVIFTDFDRDGNIDLFVPMDAISGSAAGRQQDRLYQGDGTGKFTEVTASAGVETTPWQTLSDLNEAKSHSVGWGGTACDLNYDGTPELMVASYGRYANHLWQGMRDGVGNVSYENRSLSSTFAWDTNMGWGDNFFAMCYCALMEAAGTPGEDCCQAESISAAVCSGNGIALNADKSGVNGPWSHNQDRMPFRNGGVSSGGICADINGDGHLDYFLGAIHHAWAGSAADSSEVLINAGTADVLFTRPGDDALGLAIDHSGDPNFNEGHMTQTAFDFDNDGRIDLFQGASDYPDNRALLYHQKADGTFEGLATADFFDHHRSHGVAVADFDQDGALDIAVGHGRSRCSGDTLTPCYPTAAIRVFRNLRTPGNFTSVELIGAAGTNSFAFGARLDVVTSSRHYAAEVSSGYGHFGAQNPRVQHLGLGDHCAALVRVRWPDEGLSTQTFELKAGKRYRWEQGKDPVDLSI